MMTTTPRHVDPSGLFRLPDIPSSEPTLPVFANLPFGPALHAGSRKNCPRKGSWHRFQCHRPIGTFESTTSENLAPRRYQSLGGKPARRHTGGSRVRRETPFSSDVIDAGSPLPPSFLPTRARGRLRPKTILQASHSSPEMSPPSPEVQEELQNDPRSFTNAAPVVLLPPEISPQRPNLATRDA